MWKWVMRKCGMEETAAKVAHIHLQACVLYFQGRTIFLIVAKQQVLKHFRSVDKT